MCVDILVTYVKDAILFIDLVGFIEIFFLIRKFT